MALLTNRRRRTRHCEAPTAQETAPPGPARRRRWRLLAALLLLATLLWFSPAIVAHTPLLGWILARVAGDLNGTVAVESASLGWLSPIAARGVEVRDSNGQTVLQAPGLSGSKSLAAILWNRSKLGHLRLEQPTLSVLLRDDGSNVEDLLANYLAASEEPCELDVSLEIVDGSVSLTDQQSGRAWQIEKLQLSLSTSAGTDATLNLETSATVPDPQHPGRFAAGLTMRQVDIEDRPAATAGELKIESDDVPLAMLASLIRRFAPRTQVSGRLRCKIDTQWSGEAEADQTTVRADVAGEDLTLSAPWLGSDRLQLSRPGAACQVARQADRIEVMQSSVDCDLGNVSLRGTLDLADRQSKSLLTLALQQACEIDGRIELARLAHMLPGTLRIRPETEVTSGQVQLALSGSRDSQGPEAQGMVWRGRIEAANLKATYRGRQLAWEKPILVTLAARDGREGPVVESLKCESDFLKLNAAGTPRELAASASFNLKELADQLGQFVDLGGIELDGDGWAQLNWSRSEQQQFAADAELQLRGFRLVMPQRQPWTEENLLVFLSASGRTGHPLGVGTDTRLHAASLELKSPTEHVQAELTQPVLDFRGGGTWPVKLQAQGQLQNWPARVARWFGLQDGIPSGAYALTAQATASAESVTVLRSKLTVEQLRWQTASLSVDEPHAELDLSGNWDLPQHRLRMEAVSLASQSLSIQASPVVLDLPERSPPRIAASLRYQGNLGRIHRWIADPNRPATWQIAGDLSGTAELSQSAGRTNGQVDAQVGNLDLTLSSGKRLQEPQVHLVARGGYEHQAKILRLERADLTADSLGVQADGQIAQANQQTDLQLAGQIQYDLEKLAGLWQSYVGSGVRIVGRGTSPASYRGPLDLAKAQADAGVRWERADAYGFQVGPGELKAGLAGGVLQAEPLDLAVNGGRLLLAPRLRLAPEPTELSLPPGPVVKQVQITPAMCASALKYIAPVLADVSTAEGNFSIDLDGCRVPLDDPAKGELAGRFTIHSVQVGPGPLVRELAILLGRAAPANLRRESVVPFRMVGGRVYHQGLELIFPDLTIRTYGSVGLDQTLAVMAEMPVPPKWLGNNVLGSALRDQTIRLPIGGTLSKPQLDRREMDRVSRQFLENAARNVLLDELQKQLERLPGPQR